MVSSIILLIVAVVLLIVAFKVIKSALGLALNAIIGLVLFLVTNEIGLTSIEANIFNILICAIGGAPGAIILIILNILGIY